MPWLPSAFRGASFLVESYEDEAGRRVVNHQFPGRDTRYVEDLGLDDDVFMLECKLVGPGYELALQTLEKALRQPGPGPLDHPRRGTLTVALNGRYRVRHSTDENGMCRLSIPFLVTGEQSAVLSIRPDTVAIVQYKRTLVTERLGQAADGSFSVDGFGFLASSASARMAEFGSALQKTRARIATAFGVIDDASSAIDQFTADLTSIIRTPETLALKIAGLINAVISSAESIGNALGLGGLGGGGVGSPGAVAVSAAALSGSAGLSGVTSDGQSAGVGGDGGDGDDAGIIGGARGRGDLAENAVRVSAVTASLNSMGRFGDDFEAVALITPSRIQEQQNQDFIRDTVQASAIAEVIAAVSSIPLESAAQAEDVREVVDDRVNSLLDRGTLDDGVDAAIRELRAAFYEHLHAATAEASVVNQYTPAISQPALLVAWRLYADATKEADIIRRNPSINSPLFVQGGVPINVLVD